MSVSLVRENLIGLRQNLKHKIQTLVTARPAIVTEDQMDSLSFYDDVNAPSLGGDLYESIAGSILNLAKRNSSMEDMYSSVLYSPQKPVSMVCFIALSKCNIDIHMMFWSPMVCFGRFFVSF